MAVMPKTKKVKGKTKFKGGKEKVQPQNKGGNKQC